jgi:hypothetical protein
MRIDSRPMVLVPSATRVAPFSAFASSVLWTLTALAAPSIAQEQGAEVPERARVAPDPSTLEPVPEARRGGFDSIDPELCREWLSYLASDELGGRDTGRPGYRLAAEFVAKKFEEFGLEPVGDDGTYFQAVPFVELGPVAQKSFLAVSDAQGTEVLRIAVGDGLGGQIGEESDADGALVVVDADEGIAEGVELEGRFVLLRGDLDRRTLFQVFRAGPAGMLTVDDEAAREVSKRIELDTGGRDRTRNARFRMPNRYVLTAAQADRLAEAAAAEGAVVHAHIEIEKAPVFAANVVGFLEGSDPELKNEIVGIGSHLDHVGQRGESIYNGADDDASGTTGVLAVARAFHVNGTKPRRSLLFLCFSGEEKGLIGSRHYVENPIFPNERMVAELQMDMIGRWEENPEGQTEAKEDNVNTLHLIGSQKLSDEMHAICLELNERHVGFEYEFDEEDVFFRSDHVNFARQDIPIAFFFTGFHPQYHQPGDTVEKIDFDKLARVAKLVYSIAFEIADRDEKPNVDRTFEEVNPRRRRGQ